MFKLILFDIQKELCNEFEKGFNDLPNVEILHSTLESLPEYDCMVSPANSFGLMDGGIDLAITNYFGKQLMQRVQKYIIENYAGEQPIGTSFIIETNNDRHPYLAHTPTMRIPMDIRNTDNVYQAMKAMLIAVNQNNNIKSIACCGLGTATGRVSYSVAAKQMALAYKNFLNPPTEISWKFAHIRNLKIIQSY
jgi:O-acetyl-ADP-ribose deacetylase (regulator of RNase III)